MIAELAAGAAGIVYANLIEWLAHKYVLHGLGKNKMSFWAFHWHHHGRCRRFDNADAGYQYGLLSKLNVKETLSVALLMVAHVPLVSVSPAFTLCAFVSGISYLLLHRYSHVNSEWGKRWMPWHYDHHMGRNQDANWCVTWPLWDWLLGTRVVDKSRS